MNNRIQNSENIRTANQRYGPGSDASALIPPDGKTKYRPDFLYCPAQDSTLNVTCDVLTNLTRNLYVFLPHQIHPHAVQQCNPRQSEKSRCQCAQRIDSDARIQPFFLQISVYQKNCDHSKNQPQHKIQRKLRSLFHKPSRPDFVDLYIFLPVTQIFVSYDGNNRRYFFSLPGYSLSGCIFLPVFLYTVTNSPAKAVRIPGISNVTTLSFREEHT